MNFDPVLDPVATVLSRLYVKRDNRAARFMTASDRKICEFAVTVGLLKKYGRGVCYSFDITPAGKKYIHT